METPARTGSFSFGASLADFKISASGDPEARGAYTMRGHAAVFNRLSHDLGGFKTRIRPGFFTDVLDAHPDVHLNREHDMRMLLSRTKTGALELREDPYGLHVWSKWSKTALADETAILMADGTLDQMSFACDIGTDEWTVDEDGNVTRDLLSAAGLYDVALCAQGAFPQTSADLVASLQGAEEAFALAKAEGRIREVGEATGAISVPVDLAASNTELEVAPTVEGSEKDHIAQESEGVAVVAARGERDLAAFQRETASRYARLTHPE